MWYTIISSTLVRSTYHPHFTSFFFSASYSRDEKFEYGRHISTNITINHAINNDRARQIL